MCWWQQVLADPALLAALNISLRFRQDLLLPGDNLRVRLVHGCIIVRDKRLSLIHRVVEILRESFAACECLEVIIGHIIVNGDEV